MLEAFLQSIAWPMTPPQAYGPFHLIFTISGFILSAVSAWKLRKVSDKTANIILFACGLVLILTEILKQLFYFYVIEDHAYHWGAFPFQLCSIPMYMCLIVPFLKPGKLRRAMYSFMVLYNLLGGAISFTEPSGLFHSYVLLTAHSCLWHMLLVFVGLFLVISNRGGTEKEDYCASTKIFLLLSYIAFSFNFFVQNGLGENMNMFFVGPGNSPIIVFKQISETFGWYINTPIYLFAVCLGAYLVFCMIRKIKSDSFK